MAIASRFAKNKVNLNPEEEFYDVDHEYHDDKGIQRLNRKLDESLRSFNPDSVLTTFMYYMFSGLINKGYVKEGYFIKMRYGVYTGKEWQLVSGNIEGEVQEACISQIGQREMCWNAPLNAVYRTLEVSGWPKLIIWLDGPNWFGRDCIRGYGCIALPQKPGKHKLRVNIFKPVPNTWWGRMFGYQPSDGDNTLKSSQADILSTGFGREVTCVENMGYVNVEFVVTLRNFDEKCIRL